MTSVTVVGSINIDLTSYLDRWPKIGETISVRETVTSLGGKGANQAVAAARLLHMPADYINEMEDLLMHGN